MSFDASLAAGSASCSFSDCVYVHGVSLVEQLLLLLEVRSGPVEVIEAVPDMAGGGVVGRLYFCDCGLSRDTMLYYRCSLCSNVIFFAT